MARVRHRAVRGSLTVGPAARVSGFAGPLPSLALSTSRKTSLYSKQSTLSIGLLWWALCTVALTAATAQHRTDIPLGGNTFYTGGTHLQEITEQGIEQWAYSDDVYEVFFSMAQPQTVQLSLRVAQSEGALVMVEVSDKQTSVQIPQNFAGEVAVGTVALQQGYNHVRLTGLQKNGADFAQVSHLVLTSPDSLEAYFVRDNGDNRFYWGRRGPSVHLSFRQPADTDIKWFYSEIRVPEGNDVIGSYYMANGFAEGYFGMQVNSETERRILFSVWSPFETDDPNSIPEGDKIKLLKKGEGVYTGEFGNEGAGGQSYWQYAWRAGKTYCFLNSVEPDGHGNTVYTAYFKAADEERWQLIASFLRPKTDTWYQRAHSFLENFEVENGYLTRKAFYGNQWFCDKDGHWTEARVCKLSGDDMARRRGRLDFDGGAEGGAFFMQNGGFFDGKAALGQVFERPPAASAPKVDFSKL